MSELRTCRRLAVAIVATAVLAAGVPGGLAAQDVDLNLPDLPPGKKVTIKFRGTVSASLQDQILPLISNQGDVTEATLGTVKTDDPDAGGAADPTTTMLDSLELSDRVWLDGNGNQTFDGGEGVMGVDLSLFADVDDSGTLTGGDGLAIATTTTGADGLYSFLGLAPGDYIVRVDASNFQSGGALEGFASIPDPGGTPIDPDDNVNHDDNGVDEAAPATNGVASLAITLAYNAETMADGTGQLDINDSLDLGFVEGPDIEITKSESADPVIAGSGSGNLVYTITAKNNGPVDATGLKVTDTLTLPTGVNVDTAAPSAGTVNGTNSPIVWTIGPLANGASATLTLTLTVAADTAAGAGVISDTAAVTALNESDPVPANDSVTESTSVEREVDLKVTKSESIDPVIAGSGAGNLTYVVTVENLGPSDASGVTLSEAISLPATGVTLDSVTESGSTTYAPPTAANGTWTVGTLAAGASETLTVVLTVEAAAAAGAGVISDTATVTAVNEPDSDPLNDSATESTSIERRVDLEVTKTESIDPVIAGSGAGNLTYVVTVTNLGPSDASGVELSEDLTVPSPVSVEPVTASVGTSFTVGAPPDGTWMVGDLAAGASATLTVVLTAPAETPDGTVVSDTATVTAVNETDTDSGNDSASESTTVERRIDLVVAKSESVDPVIAGSGPGNLTYVVTVTNNGPSDASGVELFDDLILPGSVTVDSVTPSGGTTFIPTTPPDGTWDVGDLPVGEMRTLTVVLTVPQNAQDGVMVRNKAFVTASNEVRISTGDDLANVATTVLRQIDLVLSKTESADPVVAGAGLPGNLTYVVTIVNNGPSNASGVEVLEDLTLPAGTSVVSITASGSTTFTPTVAPDGTWSVGALAAGSLRKLTVVLSVGPSTLTGVDVVGDTAAVTASNETRINTGDDAVTETTSVIREVDFLVTKTDSPDPVASGAGSGALTYVTTVDNLGPSDALDVTIDDTVVLPPGVTVESVTPSDGGFVDPTWTVDIPAAASVTLTMVLAVDATAAEGTDVISNTATVTGVAAGHTVLNPGNDSDTESTSIVRRRDFGDAPDPTYPTRLASDGARHILLPGGPLLGAIVDGEIDGQPNAAATGDDLSAGRPDDEDGVVFGAGLVAGTTGGVTVTASAACLLDAWIDFNDDGDWADAGEQIFADEPLAAGANALTFDIPAAAKAAETFSRFRVSTAGGLTFTGEAADGEVEDHRLEITRVSDLEVAKSQLYEPVMAGKLQVYTAVVTNHGPSNAEVTLEDTLPAGVFFLYAEPIAPACAESGNVVSCDLGEIAVGEAGEARIAVLVAPTTAGTLENAVEASTPSDDPDDSNDAASVSTAVEEVHALASLPDINGNGSSEIAVLLTGSLRAEVRDGATGDRISSMQFGSDGFVPIAMVPVDSVGYSPAPVLAFLAERPGDRKVKIFKRDSLSGDPLGVIPVSVGGFEALFMARVPHFDGLATDALAVILRRTSDGAIHARVRDTFSGALVNTTAFSPVFFPLGFAVSPDYSGNDVSELVDTGIRSRDGAILAITRDAATGAVVTRIPFRPGFVPIGTGILPDINANSVPEQVSLVLGLETLVVRAEVRDPVVPAKLAGFIYGLSLTPFGLAVVPDFADTAAAELGALTVNALGTLAVKLSDGSSGLPLGNLALQNIYRPLAMAVVQHYGGTPAAEVALLVRGILDGEKRIFVRDAASGANTVVGRAAIPIP